MINYETFTLANGLKVIHHLDESKSSAVLNLLYNVGARDENPEKTGFAHLFEHLMFGGSKNIASFDEELQKAGGTNNAFTSNDITNYYIEVPVQNIETAFWLESDRMLELDFSQKSLDVQKGVVIEEFKQRYLNQPYGKAYLHLRENAYQTHPYRWATIGKEISHIENATLTDVKEFFYSFYRPNNATLCVAGNITLERTKELCTKWFADIASGKPNANKYVQEEKQSEERRFVAPQANAQKALYIGFHKGNKTEQSHYTADLMSDIMANGKTSYLYVTLVAKRKLFSSITVYVGDDLDPGLLYIIGKVSENTSIEEAEQGLWTEIEAFKASDIDPSELQSRKNKIITAKTYQDSSLLNKAMSLCISERQGNIELINTALKNYNLVEVKDIKNLANKILRKTNCTTIVYDKILK